MTKPKSSGQNAGLNAQQANIATASTAPACATRSPDRALPGTRVVNAVRATLKNESGSSPRGGGTRTYCLRPSQKISVAMNIRMPGMPNATAGP